MLPFLLVAGAVGANLAFVGLGVVFGYPDVLARPAPEVLDLFAQHQFAVSALFVLLAASAGLLAPISTRLAARAANPANPAGLVVVGTAAAAVQVIGLVRWPLIVPFVDDPDTFRTLSTVLGTSIGETLGYALTAVWTILVARQFGLRPLAWPAAALVALGVLIPLGVPGTDLANFVGYVLWTVWLVAMAVRVWQPSRATVSSGA
ncbi:DUF4386 domain-containing protein [Actinokineospora sp. NBRC 105648]|uniref:DUF4386 domain-containing protein n=1 Tax=Actinokineospora sp. NBRC 105648 TaxID=3032206 RepID=UPI0024A407F8|nr:DUF4386 domain-containing protein [Actinokineospora sp. NBRC 105648]GLZ39266.1 hypothetical protein Acsp05_28900 [Actinokineospora sp. NBRC 105648]